MLKAIPRPFTIFSPVGESGPRRTGMEVVLGALPKVCAVGTIGFGGDCNLLSLSRLSLASSVAWHDGQRGIV